MLYSTILFAASAFTGFAAAQNYTIDPNSVTSLIRQNWCRAETNTCPILCGGYAPQNTCDQSTLKYACACSNGLQPDLSKYQNTVPSFVCAEYKGQCLSNNAGNATAQDACQSISCGTASATNLVASSTSASSSSSATSAIASGASSASSTASSAVKTGAASANNVAKEGVFAASLFGLLAYAL